MKTSHLLLSLSSTLLFASCQTQLADNKDEKHEVVHIIHGEASWYEIKCNGGTHTASGIPLQDHAMTAAHKTLPMGTKVRVTNKRNGKSVIVKITDRGPYIKGRVIDITKGAAKELGLIHRGVGPCKVEVLVDKVDKNAQNAKVSTKGNKKKKHA